MVSRAFSVSFRCVKTNNVCPHSYNVTSGFHHAATLFNPIQSPEEKQKIPIFKYGAKEQQRSKRIYLWGCAATGALGEPRYLKPTQKRARALLSLHKPGRLRFAELNDVTDVACGFGFTVFAVRSKNQAKVFGTGINTSSQIGVHEVRKGHPFEFVLSPLPIAVPLLNPSETKVLQVACGRAHTLILTDKEGIFSLGNNSFGQCGRPIVHKEDYRANPTIHKVRGLDDVTIKKIVCGQDHTVFLTDEGKVYACGWGADGQTGLGHFESRWQPGLVKGDIGNERIVHLSSSGDCVLAVSDNGDVFGWGNSEYKQLAPATDEQQICYARYFKIREFGKILQAAAASTMCAILNDRGHVFVWGYGVLGKGPIVESISYPDMLPEPLFGRNVFNTDVTVTDINAGLNHFAAITNKGDLYMWGKNSRSCLGLGHPKDQYFPFKVCVPAEVQRLSCGKDHTAAFCKAFV
uniref:RCC1-like G exchanging factor-like protein n=1 Tax=Strigamia maritima TaxID=126957 RepID=T1J6W7_STRMM